MFLGLFLFSIMRVMKSRRKLDESFKRIAVRLGCKYKKLFWFVPVIEGTYKGRRIRVVFFSRNSGKTSTSGIRAQVWHKKESAEKIIVYREHIFSGLAKRLGGQDILAGNPEFDKKYMIKGDDESYVRRILDSDMQHKMLTLEIPNMVVEAGSIYVEWLDRRIIDPEKMENLADAVDFLAELAEKIED